MLAPCTSKLPSALPPLAALAISWSRLYASLGPALAASSAAAPAAAPPAAAAGEAAPSSPAAPAGELRRGKLRYLAPSLSQFRAVEALADEIMEGRRAAISRGITLAESNRPDHPLQAAKLLRELQKRMVAERHMLLPEHVSLDLSNGGGAPPHASPGASEQQHRNGNDHHGNGHHPSTFRIGFSGPPGAGKSSLIETLGCQLVEGGDRVAVLAVDPSSQRSGGAILGDKTRMARLAADPRAYVRPSPARGTLGGVARATSDAMLICEAGGFNKVLVETVGVGQSETAVVDLVDCLVLVLPPLGGDELQVIKRGITEVADIVVINKADGPGKLSAARAAASFKSTLHFHRQRRRHWAPTVLTASAHTGAGIGRLQEQIEEYRAALGMAGELAQLRRQQRQRLAWTAAEEAVLEGLRNSAPVHHLLRMLLPDILDGSLAPRSAGDLLAQVHGEYD